MPAPLYMLGPFRFMTMHGSIALPHEGIVVDARLAVEGLQFTRTNQRGEPFTLMSRVDVASYEFGMNYLWIQYSELFAGGLADLIVNDFNLNTLGLQAQVLKVRLFGRGCYRAFPIVGGLTAGSTHLLEVEWDLALKKTPSS